ncbi:LysR family transcriptional regulator [Oligoflexus tunisiensis]|uniref:LysR family transcriptional regulator n=1 Tax=Oligoflexus tunisiensis TaxID=708132 RepID=UPI00159F2B1A|nr:LysR family transcriptional regulator [Oligoflexus tunisiensis]
MLPTYPELAGFIEIAKLGNISRAAQSLGLSQPSLSQALKKLEERVGSPLFLRQRSGVQLTDAGKVVLERAQEIIGLWGQTLSHTSWVSKELSGRIRIGCHVSVAQYALPSLMRCIHKDFPGLQTTLIHDLSRRLVDQILHYEADVAIAINPLRSSELVIRTLATDEVTFFAARPLSSLAEAENLWLIAEPNLVQTQVLLRHVNSQGYSFKGIIESASLEVCAALVRDSVGVGILPERVQRLHAPAAFKVPGAPSFKDGIKLVYRVEYAANQAVKTFMKRMEKVLVEALAYDGGCIETVEAEPV